jgi:hypothetical protein
MDSLGGAADGSANTASDGPARSSASGLGGPVGGRLGGYPGLCFSAFLGMTAVVVGSLCGGLDDPGSIARWSPGREARALDGTADPRLLPLPERLSEMGLFVAGGTTQIDPRHLPYSPQYPLWSDGASKRRWIRLPEGQTIDASDPDHFRFPVGTRFFKEFSLGSRTETRFIELTPAGPRYATYAWNTDGSDATLVPAAGRRGVRTLADGTRYDIPSQGDCALCHEGGRDVVLGFDALQLSGDRDPLAPNAEANPAGGLDLGELVRRGLIENLPWSMLETPPRLAADSPVERAARGYLLSNCGHCHNGDGPLTPLGLDFERHLVHGADLAAEDRLGVAQPSKYQPPGGEGWRRIEAGHPERSVVAYRMGSRAPAARMPPLGSARVDGEAVALIQRFITEDL